MSTRGTPATNVRLTDAEKATVEALRVRLGFPSAAAVLRRGIELQRLQAEAEDREITKSARKRPVKNNSE